MANRQWPEDIARTMWDLYSDAQVTYRKAKDQSPEQMAAIQAMATVALAGMRADELDGRYKDRR